MNTENQTLRQLLTDFAADFFFWWCGSPGEDTWRAADEYIKDRPEIIQSIKSAITSFKNRNTKYKIVMSTEPLVSKLPNGKWKAEYKHATVNPSERNYGTGTTQYMTWHDTEQQAKDALDKYLKTLNP